MKQLDKHDVVMIAALLCSGAGAGLAWGPGYGLLIVGGILTVWASVPLVRRR